MLYQCQSCGLIGFGQMCPSCGFEARDVNIPIDPRLYPEFQYKSQGLVKDLFVKKRVEGELREKLDATLEKYFKFEDPYFINYVNITAYSAEAASGGSGFSELELFHSVLVQLGFSELQEFPKLTARLVATTSFRFHYSAFVREISRHISESFQDTVASWIEECGGAFRRDLPMLLFHLWEKGLHGSEIRFSAGTVPLVDAVELDRLQKLCERIYFSILVKRLRVTLEEFDPSSFVTVFTVDAMDGYEFEDFLVRLFSGIGYDVQSTKRARDQGADLFVSKFGEKTVIQAKNYSENVGNAAVQQVLAAKTFYGCDRAMVVTNRFFTASAKELAESAGVKLVDRQGLQSYLDDYNRILMETAASLGGQRAQEEEERPSPN